jgi:hypothetical protein
MASTAISLNDIDEHWLSESLEAAGVALGAHVQTFIARAIGTGQVGENVRFLLDWSQPRDDLPKSVVGKFPSTSEVSLAAAAATQTYVREIGFYRDLQNKVDIRTPRLFKLEQDLPANRFVLLLEDITPARTGDQLSGCNLADAQLAITAAARLHASTWGRCDELAQLSWLERPTMVGAAQRDALYSNLFAGFAARYADSLSVEQLDVGRWIGEHMMALSDIAQSGDLCLAHNDFRLDNMLFGRGFSGPEPLATDRAVPALTVVDWQTARLGSGPADAAYFVGAGLLEHDRRRHETSLLDTYAQTLGQYGVSVDRDSLDLLYKVGATTGYIMAVIASQIVEQTERGDAMFVAMASRHAGQILDLDVAAAFA